ncbi:ABC transporter substrate-binding protein [Shewanella sp. HL-SH2]|uniref:ABC transporter substrate-binding protein n=1 Tax=Shewanella sp. HL-SH2 TaxID=3436238 RepID=UPI003EBE743B
MQVGKYLKVHILLIVGLLMSTNILAVTLNVLEWEGYISPFKDDFKAYAKTKGMEVELNIMDPYITDPELIFNKMRASAADVTTPTHNYYKMNQDRLLQVLQPIDFSRLTNYSKVLGSLRISQYDEFKGEKYSVPLLGGSYGLAYNAAKRDEPKSWEVLWQPENKGKYAITGDQFEANIYTTLLVLGYPPESFYDIDAATLDKSKVQAKLDSLVQNADSFWGGMADVERMKDLELVTTYWFGVAAANQSGQNWKLATPKEGQTVWLDTLAIGKHLNGEKLDAAYLLLDFMISEPVQKRILEMYGSIIVNGETAKLLDPQLVKDARVGDETFFSEQYLWRPLSSRTRNTYKQMWNKAKAN